MSDRDFRGVSEGDATVLLGSCLDILPTLPDASVDSIVTDPPYEIGFMGRAWDSTGIAYSVDVWAECLRVLKPGGHLLAFGATRSYHRMAVAIEDAGFEIRDSIHWTYGSGFPKSLDVSKAIDKAAGAERPVIGKAAHSQPAKSGHHGGMTGDGIAGAGERFTPDVTAPATDDAKVWSGWGTALKPSHEPIVVARKPLTGTVAANVLQYGTGGLNIDGTRVGSDGSHMRPFQPSNNDRDVYGKQTGFQPSNNPSGRWPANTVLTHAVGCTMVGEKTVKAGDPNRFAKTDGGSMVQGKFSQSAPIVRTGNGDGTETVPQFECVPGCPVAELDQQADGSSRFFTNTEWQPADFDHLIYVAKPSKKERNAGLDGLPEKRGGAETLNASNRDGSGDARTQMQQNFHPTVKPIALMRHLIRLVTPPGGTVLDPFTGSGTTGVAALLEGNQFIGCELTEDYLPIIAGRLAWAVNETQPAAKVTPITAAITEPTLFDELKEAA